jgi:hypothetical protein
MKSSDADSAARIVVSQSHSRGIEHKMKQMLMVPQILRWVWERDILNQLPDPLPVSTTKNFPLVLDA